MEVTFNGKSISVDNIGSEIFEVYANRAVKKTPSSNIGKVIGDSYSEVLKARLGTKQSEGSPQNTKAGLASGRLQNSIKISKVSQKAIKNSKKSFTISVEQKPVFNDYGLIIGVKDSFSTKFNETAILKLKQWIIFKKGKVAFDYTGIKDKDKDRALARKMLWSWQSKGKNRKVLPKWYDTFKDGGKEALTALFKNKTELETSIKNILNG